MHVKQHVFTSITVIIDKNNLRTIEKRCGNEPRPEFTGFYKKKSSAYMCTKELLEPIGSPSAGRVILKR